MLRRPPAAALALAVALLPACRSSLPPHRTLVGTTGEEVELGELADQLAVYDVVFLGELHDSSPTHRLQLAVTEALLERRGALALSLEMFERDVQGVLDDYLAGRIDEAAFLAGSRPWSNYARHYRPAVELARRRGLPVLAANVPRPLAARVSREGPSAVMGEEHMPRRAYVHPAGSYYDRVRSLSDPHRSEHEDDSWLAPLFAAQCVKDDAMAESIADFLDARGPDAPLVVHWCGRFHSDFHLGTVERLRWRRPDLAIAVVTVSRGRRLDGQLSPEELAAGDFVWRVRD